MPSPEIHPTFIAKFPHRPLDALVVEGLCSELLRYEEETATAGDDKVDWHGATSGACGISDWRYYGIYDIHRRSSHMQPITFDSVCPNVVGHHNSRFLHALKLADILSSVCIPIPNRLMIRHIPHVVNTRVVCIGHFLEGKVIQ